jgi:hypothetical protein
MHALAAILLLSALACLVCSIMIFLVYIRLHMYSADVCRQGAWQATSSGRLGNHAQIWVNTLQVSRVVAHNSNR